jgi:hypothetical protein
VWSLRVVEQAAARSAAASVVVSLVSLMTSK